MVEQRELQHHDLRYSRTSSESVSTRRPSATGMLQAISTQLRALDLDHADAAVAGDRQLRVLAEVRDLEAVRERRLDHGLASVRPEPRGRL